MATAATPRRRIRSPSGALQGETSPASDRSSFVTSISPAASPTCLVGSLCRARRHAARAAVIVFSWAPASCDGPFVGPLALYLAHSLRYKFLRPSSDAQHTRIALLRSRSPTRNRAHCTPVTNLAEPPPEARRRRRRSMDWTLRHRALLAQQQRVRNSAANALRWRSSRRCACENEMVRSFLSYVSEHV